MIAAMIVVLFFNALLSAGTTQVSLTAIVGIGVALASGIAGTYGLMARTKDQAAAVWKGLAEAREAQNQLQAQDIAQLKAKVDLLTSEWAKEMARQIVQLVERERLEGRS